jgi:hypothetical protein
VRVLESGRGGAGKMSSKFEGAVEGWFRNMATFIGAFYLQHPTVEIVGLLQYVVEHYLVHVIVLFTQFLIMFSVVSCLLLLSILSHFLHYLLTNLLLTNHAHPTYPVSFLRYVVRQLDCGHTEELMIVREVLARVGNCELVEQVTDEQVS